MRRRTREERLRGLLLDAMAVAGLGLVGAGIWQIYPPAAEVVVGLVLLAGGIWGTLLRRPTRRG